MKTLSKLLCFSSLFIFYFLSAKDPTGWVEMKKTIEQTPFSNVQSLLNRTFDLEVEGATEDYQFRVNPKSAFNVERLTTNKFRVKIINPEALVKRDLIIEYNPIGWNLEKSDQFIPSITGVANCLYNIIFSQNGVGEIDLSKFDAEYDISHELSNPSSIFSVSRSGKGLNVIRSSNFDIESKIKLKIKKRANGSTLFTDWILIPICKSETPKTTFPSTGTNRPESPNIIMPAPDEMIDIKVSDITFCEETNGTFCSTLTITAKNKSDKMIKCNTIYFKMFDNTNEVASETQWLQLGAGETHTFYINLKAKNKPLIKWDYKIKKTDCFYN